MVAEWCLGGVDPGGWDPVRDAVDEVAVPASVFVPAVVAAAEQGQLFDPGSSGREVSTG